MTRLESYLLLGSNLVVAGTGVIYAIMRYLLEPADEWAVVNHPWQPHIQHLHVLAAPALVFMVALVWKQHALGNLREGYRRVSSGLMLLVSFLPMVATGYLIQIAVAPGWRLLWVVSHMVTSGLWLGGFVVHWLARIRASEPSEVEHRQAAGSGSGSVPRVEDRSQPAISLR
jgi:hypothetical protein